MAERNKISKNTPKFMLDFFNKYREADKRWREMQQEAKIASTVLEKLQKEYAATPLTLFGKKQQLANAIKEVSAFTDSYFNGKLPGEGSEKWSLSGVKDTIQTGVAMDKAIKLNNFVEAMREIGENVGVALGNILPKVTYEDTSETPQTTPTREETTQEILRQTKERQANGEPIPTNKGAVSQEEWENHLRNLGVDVDKLKGTDTDTNTNTNTNTTDAPTATPAPVEDTAEYVEYTYKPGDTFGQVIKNLGLDEGNLWGDNGSVKFYTDQLWSEHPEVFDQRGNIKIGQTIKLRKRGTGSNTTPAATTTQSTQPAQVTPPANAIPDGAFQPVYDTNRKTTTYVPAQARLS